MNFPVHFPSQLREHLRALRKARGLTQAALGQLLGVGQARIAEIENNPGVVSVDQLMKVLSALRASVVLHDDDDGSAADRVSGEAKSSAFPAPDIAKKNKPVPRLDVKTPAAGQRRIQPFTGAGRHAPKSAPVLRSDAKASDGQTLPNADPQRGVTPPSPRNFIIRPKKGSW